MFHSKWKCFAAVALMLCSLPLLALDEHPLPAELSSAKSMALIVRVIGNRDHQSDAIAKYKAKIESKALAEIQKQQHFQLVSDPSKADIVCVLMAFWGPVFREGKSMWNRSATEMYLHPPEALVIFKGGNNPQWNAFPLWMKTGTKSSSFRSTPADLLKDFHNSMKKMKTGESPGSTQDASGSSVVQEEVKEEDGKPASKDAKVASTDSGKIAREEHNDSVQKEQIDGSTPKAADPVQAVTVFCQFDLKDCQPAKFIYSATTLIVCDPQKKCNPENVQKALQPGGRWSLVNDPQKADLIMILADDWANDPEPGGALGAVLGGAKFSTMYLFKGGSKPDWQAMPLFTTVGGGGLFSKVRSGKDGNVLASFEKFITETAPSTAQAGK